LTSGRATNYNFRPISCSYELVVPLRKDFMVWLIPVALLPMNCYLFLLQINPAFKELHLLMD